MAPKITLKKFYYWAGKLRSDLILIFRNEVEI